MNRHDLEHLIRSASQVADAYELIIIGSQSIHGQFLTVPSTLTMSDEADMFVENNERASDAIDANIGELSNFHSTHGYYAQGVGIETASLPTGWKERLVTIQNDNTDLRIGRCLHPTDLAAAKLAAGRERDWPFVSEMLFHGLVQAGDLIQALHNVPADKLLAQRVEPLCVWVSKQAAEHQEWRSQAQERMRQLQAPDKGMSSAIAVELKQHNVPKDISKFNAETMHRKLLEQAVANGQNLKAAGQDLNELSPWAVRPLEQEIVNNTVALLARQVRTAAKPK